MNKIQWVIRSRDIRRAAEQHETKLCWDRGNIYEYQISLKDKRSSPRMWKCDVRSLATPFSVLFLFFFFSSHLSSLIYKPTTTSQIATASHSPLLLLRFFSCSLPSRNKTVFELLIIFHTCCWLLSSIDSLQHLAEKHSTTISIEFILQRRWGDWRAVGWAAKGEIKHSFEAAERRKNFDSQ